MANVGTVEALLQLKDEFTGVLGKAVREMDDAGSKLQKIGSKMSSVGTELTKVLTLPIAAVGAVATKSFGSFDQAMTESTAIMGDLSDTMRTDLEQTARNVALEVKASATDAAQSYFYLASAGLDAAASMEALPIVAKFSQAGMFDMARATDLLTDAQSALGLTIKDDVVKNTENMIRISDVLVKANTIANASVEQFSTSLTSKAGTAMKALGIEIESGVAVLAAWADQGIKAELAGERFNIVTRDMQTAAIKNADVFRRYGIQVYDLNEKFRPLSDIVSDMERALGGMSDKQRKATLMMLGFSDRSVQATQSLLGLSGKIKAYETQLHSAAGITDEVAKKQLQSLWAQVGLLKDRFIDAAITLGQSLTPAFEILLNWGTKLADGLRNLAKWFSELPKGVRLAVIAFAGILAAIGPVLVVVGGLITAVGAVASGLATLGPILATVGGFFASVVGILTSWPVILGAIALSIKPVRDFLIDLAKTVLQKAKLAFIAVKDAVIDWWKSTETARRFLVALVKVIATDVWGAIVKVVGKIREFISSHVDLETAVSVVKAAFIGFVKGIKDTFNWIGDLYTKILDFVGGMDGLLNIFKLLNPSMAGAITKLQEWVKEAKYASGAGDNLSITGEEVANNFGYLSKKFAEWADEEKKAADSLVESADDVADATSGLASSVVQFGSKMEGTIDLTESSTKAFGKNTDAVTDSREAYNILKSTFALTQISAEEFRNEQHRLSQAEAEGRISSDQLSDALDRLQARVNNGVLPAVSGVRDEMSRFADEFLRSTPLITNAISSLFGPGVTASLSGFVQSFTSGFGSARDAGLGFVDSMKSGWESMKDSLTGTMQGIMSGLQAMEGGVVNVTTGIVSAIANFQEGNVVGGWAAAIGAGLGLLNSLFGSNRRSIEEIRESFQGFVSDILSGKDAISAMGEALVDFKELVSRDVGAAAIEFRESFGDIVDSVLSDIDSMGDSIAGTFESFAGITFVQNMVGQAMFGDLGADVIAQQLDKVKNKFFEVMGDMKALMIEQSGNIVDSLTGTFGDFSSITAAEFKFASESALQAFNAMLDAGVPLTELVAQFGPLFDQMGARAAELGIEIPAQFSRIGEVMTILSNTALQGVIDKLVGIGEVAVAAGNLGLLTEEQIRFLGNSAQNTYQQLIDGGLNSNEALAAIAPTLQQLLDLQEMYGYEINDSTQALLDQAIAQGVVASKGLDTNDILIAGFERMLEALNRLIVALGGVPVAFDGWIDSVEEMGTRTRRTLRDVADEAERTGSAVNDAVGDRTGGQGGSTSGGGGGGAAGGQGAHDRGGYQHGTGGFLDFGQESIVALHGREEVINFDQGKSLAEMVHMAIRGTQSSAANGDAGIADNEMIQLLAAQNSILMSIATALDGRSRFETSMETRNRVQR